MAGVKRPKARIVGSARALEATTKAGADVKLGRQRRHMKQATLAARVGITQGRLAQIEAGLGEGAPAEVWFALAEALGRYLKFEFARDPQDELKDAGHLAIQELVLRISRPGGWEGGFELPTRPTDPTRSVDVPLLDRLKRRLAIVECWNTFGDLGAAARSDNQKLAAANEAAAVLGGDDGPYAVGLCWVVRDTKRNRELVKRYEHIFKARFPGSSQGWVDALTKGTFMPTQPGLVWCDVGATRLFAHRRARGGEPEPAPR
jgi:transcriptional regulator with XRE-family HTH domain